MLKHQKEIGTLRDIQAADIHLKELHIKNGDYGLLFQKYLWEYGYNKARLIYWALGAFGLFYLINLIVLRKLLSEVYSIPALYNRLTELVHKRIKLAYQPRYYMVVLMYSSLIFFGIKMDPDHFTFKRLGWTMYLWFFYLIGLLLVFYLIGLIIAK